MGLEYAKIHASRGGDLVIVSLENENLNDVKIQLEKKYGIKVLAIEKDLSIQGSPKEIFDEVNANHITVDYLINNAGFGDFGLFAGCDWSKQEKMIHLNVIALAHLTRLFLPGMIGRGNGKILNMASTASFQPGPSMSVYFATKAFVLSFSEALSNETENTGVTVTAVCPGSTKTRFNKLAAGDKKMKEKNKKRPSAYDVALFGYNAMIKGKKIAIHRFKNAFIVFALRFLPRNFVVKAARKIQESKF